MTEDTPLFTEEDKEALESLTESERVGFMNRLANLQMKYMLADSAWEKEYSECKEEMTSLIKDIKAKLPKPKVDPVIKMANSLTDENCFGCNRENCGPCEKYDHYFRAEIIR